jgi:hypothetical protein
MKINQTRWSCLFACLVAATLANTPMAAQQQPRPRPQQVQQQQQQQPQKPNILFIMGDDIGWMQPSIYQQGNETGSRAARSAASPSCGRCMICTSAPPRPQNAHSRKAIGAERNPW